MYLKKYYDEEIWKEIELKAPFSERFRLYVSNYGQIKKYNKISATEIIITQTKTEGYPSFTISFLGKISEQEQQYFNEIRKHINVLRKEIKNLTQELTKCDGRDAAFYDISKKIEESQILHDTIKSNYTIKYKKSEGKRKNSFGNLTHRLVAIYFLERPSEEHKFVAHLDFDKENNHHSNLKWMTQKENTVHQQNSPYVIKAKATAVRVSRITRQKLTVHQVMVIKKRINEEVPLSKLAKRYKVSETQLLRIKRGINWVNIPAAR
ncbi:MAG: HNH endonuclease [Bacteroidota bacterium]